MTIPVPRDQAMLSQASCELEEAVTRSGLAESPDLRLRLLEGAAARVGGFDLDEFDMAVGGINRHDPIDGRAATGLASKIAQAAEDSLIPASLALASLGDSNIDPVVRRRQGRYFTDSRLALNLASSVRQRALGANSVLDPACGAGALLIAATLQVGANAAHRTHFIRHVLWGVDRDARAVRAARAAVSSLTSDLVAIAKLSRRLFVADSLTAGRKWWADRFGGGFDLVVGNPPWEKLRVTRHEHALGIGHQRHYGDVYYDSQIDERTLLFDRRATVSYRDRIGAELTLQGQGESDLHKMFIELSARLTSDSGALAFLVPAGFIRNHSAGDLRQWLFRHFDIDILILDNRDRYFAIDSRFKFIQLLATRNGKRSRAVRFGIAHSENNSDGHKIETNFWELKNIQPDLALPEVRDRDDWELFTRLRHAHPDFGSIEADWRPRFHREVDMTSDRPKFKSASNGRDDLPVIEGRMVHQHRAMAKRYISGRGRRAEWQPQFPYEAALRPQWHIRRQDLRAHTKARVDKLRAGFCDITGQTNERTVLAALIPGGVVCGNKVPTIDFCCEAQACAWVGIANSFTFDWLARRLVTTTLNFFMLRSLPTPKWDAENEGFGAIAEASRSLASMECQNGQTDLWDLARIRAKIEVLSALLYDASVSELDQMLRDFPQVDRSQPALPGETKSTVTRDLIVASGAGWATLFQLSQAENRVMHAQSVGAIPFIPNEHARAYRRATLR